MATDFIAGRMMVRRLLPDKLSRTGDMDAILKKARTDLLRRIKRTIVQTAFSQRAKKALAKAITVEVKPASLVVIAKHPAFKYLVEGRRRRQMVWLKRARRPIPIITETGKLIFRSAHARSRTWKEGPQSGPNVGRARGWLHPGKEPQDFVERAKEEARTFLTNKFKEELVNRGRAAFRQKR